MSDFIDAAILRVLEKADALGVEVSTEDRQLLCGPHGSGTLGAILWAKAHPDKVVDEGCCWGTVQNGPEGCTCWVAVYDVEQAEPQPGVTLLDARPAAELCHDCAFRPGSPERSEEWLREELYASADAGRPFWCHQGMRRPALWRHPDGREVAGSPDNWTPPGINGVPFKADGTPALLCAGWAARAGRSAR